MYSLENTRKILKRPYIFPLNWEFYLNNKSNLIYLIVSENLSSVLLKSVSGGHLCLKEGIYNYFWKRCKLKAWRISVHNCISEWDPKKTNQSFSGLNSTQPKICSCRVDKDQNGLNWTFNKETDELFNIRQHGHDIIRQETSNLSCISISN